MMKENSYIGKSDRELSSNTEHKPTLRTLSILEFISAGDRSYSLSEISRALGISPSTLFPIIHTLREKKYLNFDKKTQTYSLGLRLFEIGSRIQNSHAYNAIMDIINEVVEKCDETCHFGVLDHGDVLYLAKADSTNPIRMFSKIGKRMPAYGTAIGKALLKQFTFEELKALYPEGLKPLTANTINCFDELYRQICSSDIFMYENEESNDSIRCIAIPLYQEKTVVAALSVAIPVYRYEEKKAREIERTLKEASVRFSQEIPDFMF